MHEKYWERRIEASETGGEKDLIYEKQRESRI